jgi:hypothetical protein
LRICIQAATHGLCSRRLLATRLRRTSCTTLLCIRQRTVSEYADRAKGKHVNGSSCVRRVWALSRFFLTRDHHARRPLAGLGNCLLECVVLHARCFVHVAELGGLASEIEGRPFFASRMASNPVAMVLPAQTLQNVMFTFQQVITFPPPRQKHRKCLFLIIRKTVAHMVPN